MNFIKLLVKKKNGKVHIREKSKENAENLSAVHENKVATWEAFGRASYDAAGGTMEDVIENVINEMRGVVFKRDKPKVEVSEVEYESLLVQSKKKGISLKSLNNIVTVKKIETKEEDIQKMVETFIKGE